MCWTTGVNGSPKCLTWQILPGTFSAFQQHLDPLKNSSLPLEMLSIQSEHSLILTMQKKSFSAVKTTSNSNHSSVRGNLTSLNMRPTLMIQAHPCLIQTFKRSVVIVTLDFKVISLKKYTKSHLTRVLKEKVIRSSVKHRYTFPLWF